MEIQYIRVGDYYIPDLTLPEEPRPIGKWERHEFFLADIQCGCSLERYGKFGNTGCISFIILKSESKRSARLP